MLIHYGFSISPFASARLRMNHKLLQIAITLITHGMRNEIYFSSEVALDRPHCI